MNATISSLFDIRGCNILPF